MTLINSEAAMGNKSAIPSSGDGTSIATWDVLQRLGFEPADEYFGCPAMSYDLGSFKLQATRMMNLQMREVVSFNGFVSTPRTMTSIEFDMPLYVDSKEQCAAWIAWHINENIPSQERLLHRSKAELLIFGFQHQATLPWVQEKAAYKLRPQCSVEREWLRQALKSIQQNVCDSAPDSRISISFDGRVLSFQGTNWIAPIPAFGEAWPNRYEIAVSNFYFPSRLMQQTVHISIWKGDLTLGNRLYRGVTISGTDPSSASAADSSKN